MVIQKAVTVREAAQFTFESSGAYTWLSRDVSVTFVVRRHVI